MLWVGPGLDGAHDAKARADLDPARLMPLSVEALQAVRVILVADKLRHVRRNAACARLGLGFMSEQRTAQPRALAFGVAGSRADKGHKSPPRVVSCANLDLSHALASRFVTSGCFCTGSFFFQLDVAAHS